MHRIRIIIIIFMLIRVFEIRATYEMDDQKKKILINK